MAETETAEPVSKQLIQETLDLQIGATGFTFFDGLLTSTEFNSKFGGMQGSKIYDQMRRTDGHTQASIRIQGLPIHAATWRVACENEKIQEELNHLLFERLNWDTFLRHFLLCLPFGFCLMEMIWELDNGRYWLKKLAHRAQATISKWNIDEDGELVSVCQQVAKGWTTTEHEIPSWKLFHCAINQEGNNFEGISILRSAYKHWYFKEMIEKIDGIAQERWGLGIPYAEAPETGYSAGDLTEAKSSLKNLRAGAKSWIFKPHGWDIGIMGAGEGSRLDPMPSIRYHNEQIAINSLAMFLLLGTTNSGSRALGSVHLDMFYNAEEALADMVVAKVNEQIIKPWLEINYAGGNSIEASLTWADLQVRNIEAIAKSINTLAAKGFITPDAETENLLRDQLNLPEKDEELIEEDRKKLPDSPESKSETDPEDEDDPENILPIQIQASRSHTQPHSHTHKHQSPTEGFWRPLTDVELSIALKEIEGRQDDAEDEIVQIFQQVKPSWIDYLVTSLSQATSPKEISKIKIPKRIRHTGLKATIQIQRDVFKFGKRSVRDEQNRQVRKQSVDTSEFTSRSKIRSSKSEDQMFSDGRDQELTNPEITEQFNVRGSGMFDKLSARVENVAKERALNVQRNHGEDFDEADMEFIADELEDLFDQASRLEGRALVSNAYGLGRIAEAAIRKEDISAAIYSAILDKHLCENCARFDGETYRVGDRDYHADSPPNPQCLSSLSGSNRCRCLWAYTFVTEGRVR